MCTMSLTLRIIQGVGFNSLNSDNKSVRQCENTAGAICHVKILEKYLQKIPDKARSVDNFYLTPVAILPSDPPSLGSLM